MLNYQETPLQEFIDPTLDKAGVRLLIKREDLNDPFISGNKWWKLKYNLAEAVQKNHHTLLTFGGAFSNHIFSTAAAAKELNLKSIGIIRGERIEPLNHTLSFAEECGMKLHFVSREDYRKKNDEEFVTELNKLFGDFYLIPEGGSNHLAVKGCEEFTREKLSQISFDHLFLPVGTGGTMAGIICGLDGKKEVSGISVLKNGEFLNEDVKIMVEKYCEKIYENWRVLTSYDHGGYAKHTKELLAFVDTLKLEHNLPLDTVYTGKLMWAVLKEIGSGKFPRGTTVLALHTGGLQTTNHFKNDYLTS